MTTNVTLLSNELGQVWACLAAASGRAVRQRLATGPAWDLVCLEMLDARDHLERFAPAAVRGVHVALPGGQPLELVRRAADLLDHVDPCAHAEEILALRARVRRIELLLTPDAGPGRTA